MSEVKIDLKEVEALEKEVTAAMIVSLGRIGERGYQVLREEVPVKTGNLKQGVAPPDVDEANLTATLTVSARTDPTSGGGVAVSAKGKRKAIPLKPQIPFNYAEVVARGRPALRPRAGKALLIEIEGTPNGAYIEANGKKYVVRKSAKAVPANPYDERTIQRVEKEVPKLVGDVFAEFFA